MHDHAKTAADLHEVATFIGRLPADVPAPLITDDRLAWNVWGAVYEAPSWNIIRTVPQQVRHIARALGGRWLKNDPEKGDYDETYYTLTLDAVTVGGRSLRIQCLRQTVCERVQVGTEKVTVEAKPAVVAHEEERPVYRYDCRPLQDAAGRELDDVLAEVTA